MMKKNIFCLLVIFLAVGESAVSQSLKITGIVKDAESQEGLFGATILFNGHGTISESNGFFEMEVDPGRYDLTISYVGYETFVQPFEVTDKDQFVDINLQPSSTVLDIATVTGSKYNRSVARSPVSINVIKSDLVANTNTVKINTLLDKIPGVQIVDNQAIIRGGSGWSYGAGSRVLLLIDDIPALQADAGRPSWGDIPVENISQMEVLKGASSTLYGSAAMNGIINIRTGYATSEPVTKAFTSYTHFMDPQDLNKKWWTSAPTRVSTGVVHKRKIGKLDLVANGFYENFDSYYEDAFDEKYRLSANLKYRISDKVSIGINSLYNKAKGADYFTWKNGGSGAYSGAESSYSTRSTSRFFFDPQITIYNRKNDRHKVLGRFYYIDNDNNLNQSNSSINTYLEYQYLTSLIDGKMDLASGLVSQFVESDSEVYGGELLYATNLGAFTQIDYKLSEDVSLTGGLRYEYNVQKSPEVIFGDSIPDGITSESKIISRIGINYAMSEGTFIRASWGQGYRYPTMAEKFVQTTASGFQIYPNLDLESETGWSSEIGIKQGMKFGTWLGYIDATLFWSQYENMMEFSAQSFDGTLGFQSVNVGGTDIKGFEVSVIGQSKIGQVPVNILCGYTYINPKYQEFIEGTIAYNSISTPVGETEKSNFLKYRSRHSFKTDLEGQYQNLTFGIAGIYNSEVVTMDALISNFAQIGLYREANPGGYFKLDSRVGYVINAFKVSFLVENILNEEYTARPGLLEAPRNISIRLDVEL
ncbi:MAG: TonB-dependent receptor [Saprospiraceae bacterium]|nr:TonB-dependent receptor [Saprospiraceae bacterium]